MCKRLVAIVVMGGVWLLLGGSPGAAPRVTVGQPRFLGEVTFPTGTQFAGTTVGGLSGIDFDPMTNVYYAISDDRSQLNPARFYHLTVNLSDGALNAGDIGFTGVTTMLNTTGAPFPALAVDPEAIRFDRVSRTLYWTSEGDANALISPFGRQMDVNGQFIRALDVPPKFQPMAGMSSGIRNNLVFESLTFSVDGTTLFTATENALFQDGPAASLAAGSPSRVLQWDVATGLVSAEFVYITEPVAAGPNPANTFSTNGLVEMLALSDSQFIAVERSFSTGVGNTIRLFLTDLSAATDVSGFDTLMGQTFQAMTKTLLLDLSVLGIPLDNIEGLTFGPTLPSGERTLLLVSDNNFSDQQFTQFLALGVPITNVPEPATFGLLSLGLAGLAVARWYRAMH